MAEEATFAPGHQHGEECFVLYREWRRYHAVVVDTSSRFDRAEVLAARREREMFEGQLRARGCSGEALRRRERDVEIAAHGRPTIAPDPAGGPAHNVSGRALGWADFASVRPELAEAGRELLYHFGVGLAMIGTVRPDGGPRVHPISPVLTGGRLLAFLIPSPKLRDLLRDGRYALHSYPLPHNEDALYLAGRATAVRDAELRRAVAAVYVAERTTLPPPDLGAQSLVELSIERCLLTRTTGHGDPAPRHTVWRAG